MQVLFFAQVKTAAGVAQVELAGDNLDTDCFWQALADRLPMLDRYRGHVRLARNGEFVGADARFQSGDEIALIPPVSGG
jgi:molybdopterin converting factor subunit 1